MNRPQSLTPAKGTDRTKESDTVNPRPSPTSNSPQGPRARITATERPQNERSSATSPKQRQRLTAADRPYADPSTSNTRPQNIQKKAPATPTGKRDAEISLAQLSTYEGYEVRLDPERNNQSLTDSIAIHGLQTRLFVDPQSRIISGNRRYAALLQVAKKKGRDPETFMVPVTIYEGLTKEQTLELIHLENQERDPLNKFEEIRCIAREIDGGSPRAAVARRLKIKSLTNIDEALRVYRHHTPELKEALIGGLSFAAAREITDKAIRNEAFPEDQLPALIQSAQKKKLTPAKIRALIAKLLSGDADETEDEDKSNAPCIRYQKSKALKLKASLVFDPSQDTLEKFKDELKALQKKAETTHRAQVDARIESAKKKYQSNLQKKQARVEQKKKKAQEQAQKAKAEAQRADAELREAKKETQLEVKKEINKIKGRPSKSDPETAQNPAPKAPLETSENA